MGKKKSKKKVKKNCCGKYLKKGKHCSKCPVLVKQKCKQQAKAKAVKKKTKKKKKKN